jgi:Cys-tRNA(Pro)/Cys-tRNA(Cys) deacylase
MMRKGNSARRPASSGTPAIAAAKGAGIPFSVHEYAHDPAAEAYGPEAAAKLGLDPARVLKTLVASVDGSLVMALIPVDRSLDLKALAAAVGGKRASMAEPKAAERATGYVAGGISPLGQRRRLPAVVDRSAVEQDTVFVSAGRRGLEIQLEPADLVRLLDARIALIGR